ncbi:DUF4406 domain-containing protein [Yokenella regensburgei]|nr:DUF4406 domain-containing protein [Yokenella regensburgei]
MSKIYIAGPMTGLPLYNRPAFNKAAEKFTSRGHVVLNPATLPNGLTQFHYMDICCAMLRCADTIFMLSGWENSSGARAEFALAKKLNLSVLFQGKLHTPGVNEQCRCQSHPLKDSDNSSPVLCCGKESRHEHI